MFRVSDQQEHLTGTKITRAVNAPVLNAGASGHGPSDDEGEHRSVPVPH